MFKQKCSFAGKKIQESRGLKKIKEQMEEIFTVLNDWRPWSKQAYC